MRKFNTKILTDLSASPVRCRHFTLGNPKKSFQQYYSYILPIIYVIVYDYVFIYTKNYENRLIFDRVIQRLKRWTFSGDTGYIRNFASHFSDSGGAVTHQVNLLSSFSTFYPEM